MSNHQKHLAVAGLLGVGALAVVIPLLQRWAQAPSGAPSPLRDPDEDVDRWANEGGCRGCGS